MAIRPDFDIGTLTLTSGSADFTTSGSALEVAKVSAGDAIIAPSGHVLIIASITGQNSGTLYLPCPAAAAGTDLPLRIRFQPDGSRYQGAVRNLIDLLSSGNLEALSGIVGAADQIPIFTGPGAMTTIYKGDLVDGVAFDAQVDDIAGRAEYDGQNEGFTVLVSDVGDGRSAVFVKRSNASGDWSDPSYVTGPIGPASEIEVGSTTTLPAGSPASVTSTPTPTGISLDFGIPLSELTDDDKTLLSNAVTDANAAADRAASYTPNSVSRSISGLVPYNDAVSPLTVIGVSPGTARNSTNDVDIVLVSGILKQIDAAWSAGSGQGGLDTGTVAIYTTYHLFVIRNPTSGAIDVLISASASSPLLPSGFTQYRRIAALKTNDNANIYPGVWYANGEFAFSPPPPHTMPAPTSVTLWETFGPTGVKTKVKYMVNANDYDTGNPGFAVVFRDPALGIPTTFGQFAAWKPDGIATTEVLEAWTDNLARVYQGGLFSRPSSQLLQSYIIGWTDYRDEFA